MNKIMSILLSFAASANLIANEVTTKPAEIEARYKAHVQEVKALKALAPNMQYLKEMRAILSSEELVNFEKEHGAILAVKSQSGQYVFVTKQSKIGVKVNYEPSNRIGPVAYTLHFEEPVALDSTEDTQELSPLEAQRAKDLKALLTSMTLCTHLKENVRAMGIKSTKDGFDIIVNEKSQNVRVVYQDEEAALGDRVACEFTFEGEQEG